METTYNVYSKVIQNKKFYFVKTYVRFTEYSESQDLLIGYGMHPDFTIACSIAGIKNVQVIQNLMLTLEQPTAVAKVIDIYRPVKQQESLFSILKHYFSFPKLKYVSRY